MVEVAEDEVLLDDHRSRRVSAAVGYLPDNSRPLQVPHYEYIFTSP
jgi:hypothetical protein